MKLDLLLAVFVGAAVLGAACGGDQQGGFVPTRGGSGVVIVNSPDGKGDAAASSEGGANHADGSAAQEHPASDGPKTRVDAPETGGAGGTSSAGSGGAGGAAGAAGGGGGGAGSAPVDDPCRACEKARCSKPSGLSSDKSDSYAQILGAYSICYVGGGLPTDKVDTAVCSGADPGPAAMDGPMRGVAKSTLCQAVLDCLHRTKCGVTDDRDCYCGAGVSVQTCMDPNFVPQGLCADAIEDAVESSSVGTIFTNFYNVCLAIGSAFSLYDNCDADCCPQQCLGVNMEGDETYCNAPGAGGAAGAAGTGGVGGAAGAAGAGHSGAAGSASGAAGAAGGGAGAAGASDAGAGSGGGAAGTAGTAGAAGAADGTFSSLLQNATFDASTDHWTSGASSTVAWSSSDASSRVSSGSLSLSTTGADPNSVIDLTASQCLTASGGKSYQVGAKVLVPGPTLNLAGVQLVFYPGATCSGTSLGAVATPWSVQATWQSVQAAGPAPSGTGSMAVQLLVVKPYVQTVAAALFDEVAVSSP